ncbi:MAG: hypothetical protein KGL39_03525 [Patescibacteria group bacterium]|nr:hypothetical protein [Patescibacteria group bacterium]
MPNDNHTAYAALMAEFLDCLEEGARDADAEQVMVAMPADVAKALGAVLRRSLQVPYLSPDLAVMCRDVNALLRQGVKLGEDFPARLDAESLLGRLISLASGLASQVKVGQAAATERHAVLEHVSRNWWVALDQALEENASRHAVAARRALGNMHSDDQLEVRERLAQLLCLPPVNAGDAHGRPN